MQREKPIVAQDKPRLGPGLAPIGASLLRWDVRLGTVYAELMNRRLALFLGRLMTASLVSLLMVSKWYAVTPLLGASRPAAGDLIAWSVLLDHLLHIAFLALVVFLVIVRRPARVGTARLSGIVVALGGSFAASFLVYESNAGLSAVLAPVAVLLLVLGMTWAIWSLMVLGRCFSVLPEVRGLVTGGPYRWVRHPVYLGEIIAVLGVLLPILSLRNVAIFALFCGLQVWRTRHEEAALTATFPEYGGYRRRTARLLPGLW